jgi:LuxR family maltose regulon positive regulatory protein
MRAAFRTSDDRATVPKDRSPAAGTRRGGADTARLIAREDLVARLDHATTRKVTVISAPAGSGKTSLLRAWSSRRDKAHRIAFVSVCRAEDAQRFCLALLTAIRQAAGKGDEPESPAPTPDFNPGTLAGRVLAELDGQRDRMTLVIDDLHELDSPESLAQLARLLAELPPPVHAVISTRHDLRLGLHQLRVAGDLTEIRAADLRFTQHEARELLAAADIALSAAEVAVLHQRTEGWAAGLRLAALSLAGHPEPRQFVAEFSGSDRTVAEYLLAELLDRQPAEVQQLLLRTSILDRVNGELADLLTSRAGSERILLDLEDANAFVVSLDGERTWFRYHHLFADLLRLQLRRTLPEEVPILHRRAAEWLKEHGHIADFQDVMHGFSVSSGAHPAPPAEPLSPGELRVLRYLPTNLSRPEIAAELSLSVNTIGTHLRRIYAKLGADDRTDAVRRARELRLLSAAR